MTITPEYRLKHINGSIKKAPAFIPKIGAFCCREEHPTPRVLLLMEVRACYRLIIKVTEFDTPRAFRNTIG